MTRGRKPKPTVLKLVEGNPGKRAVPAPRKAAPKKKAGRPPGALAIPSALSVEEKRIWRRMVKAAPAGLLTKADAEKLTIYCVERHLFDQASAALRTDGLFKKWGQGLRSHPAIKVRHDAADRMARILSDLGFDPTARARLGVADEQAEEVDEDEARFFG